MSAASLVLVRELSSRVVQISINRPAVRNAVDGPTAAALRAAFEAFEKDTSQRVAVLSGEGATFCGGADLKAVAEGGARMNDVSRLGPMGPTGLVGFAKPVICAVEGYAVAGGLELACWADLRVAARSAKFGVLCRRVGVPLIDGGTVRLPRLIGQSRALDLILTGRLIDAAEAERFGLVNRVVEDGEAVKAAASIAEQIAAFPSTCVLNDRKSVYAQWGMTELDAMEHELAIGRETLSAGEGRQGASLFSSGRQGRHGASLPPQQ